MFCPHCHNKIPDGSNICPLGYSTLAGLRSQKAAAEPQDAPERKAAPKKSSKKKSQAYTKGSRGGKKSADRTPMIIAFGLIMILVVIIAMIVRSMFGLGAQPAATPAPVVPQVQNTPQGNFVIFGATSTPASVILSPTPVIEVTPSPTPVVEHSYHTLRKGDQGPNVVTMQQALAELGYLNGAADGNFGTGTQTAVKNFQKDNGLDSDGIAGRMTLEALYAKSSVTPLPDNTPTAAPGDIMDLPG